MDNTATQEAYILDIRRRHADSIGFALFDEIRHLLPHDIDNEVHRLLLEGVYRNRVMLITDDERVALGLEGKDKKGWTPSARIKMEQERLTAMMAIQNIVIKIDKGDTK